MLKHGRRFPPKLGGTKPGPVVIDRPDAIPSELTGKFIAWSADGLKILGYGSTVSEARASAGDRPGLVIAWIPPLEELRPSCDSTIVREV